MTTTVELHCLLHAPARCVDCPRSDGLQKVARGFPARPVQCQWHPLVLSLSIDTTQCPPRGLATTLQPSNSATELKARVGRRRMARVYLLFLLCSLLAVAIPGSQENTKREKSGRGNKRGIVSASLALGSVCLLFLTRGQHELPRRAIIVEVGTRHVPRALALRVVQLRLRPRVCEAAGRRAASEREPQTAAPPAAACSSSRVGYRHASAAQGSEEKTRAASVASRRVTAARADTAEQTPVAAGRAAGRA